MAYIAKFHTYDYHLFLSGSNVITLQVLSRIFSECVRMTDKAVSSVTSRNTTRSAAWGSLKSANILSNRGQGKLTNWSKMLKNLSLCFQGRPGGRLQPCIGKQGKWGPGKERRVLVTFYIKCGRKHAGEKRGLKPVKQWVEFHGCGPHNSKNIH
jgi:hypothetical protein